MAEVEIIQPGEKEYSGSHFCKVCKKAYHAIPPCSTSTDEDEEGLESEFTSFFNQAGRHKTTSAPLAKRAKSGHEKTPMGFCLLCFKEGKAKFWLARGNPSSLSTHLAKAQRTTLNDAVSEGSPLAAEAKKAYQRQCAARSSA
ncbi:Hypothetical predicted protein [Paramuricea clavata]|uniref:Uncharacterized protein n=1 Tax=Paramuricea clavata TaxID=317549 RepID=A0A6S7FH29_PARCT|nr:Hypothetical predicted protein [Paramuricea clavata]